MPDTTTPNMVLIKPEIGASHDTWGNKTNGNWDKIDQLTVRQTIQWKITAGDDNPSSPTGPWILSRYGNDTIKIDEPIVVNRQTGDVVIANNMNVVKQFLSNVGTALLPAYAFLVEPALGFYRSAAGKLTFTGRVFGNGMIPAGAIMDFAMPTPPTGWLECTGASLLVADYPDLHAAIGYLYGGSGANFNLPAAADKYRRHRGSLAGAVGNVQTPLLLEHNHALSGTPTITMAAVSGHDHPAFIHDLGHFHQYDKPAFQFNQKTAGAGTIPADTTVPANTDTKTTGVRVKSSSGGAADDKTGSGGAHTPTVQSWSMGTLAVNNNGTANENRPHSLTVLTCIKT